MNGHDPQHARDELRRALQATANCLNSAISVLRNAQHLNHAHGLELELPSETPLFDALGAAESKLRALDADKGRGPYG